MSKKINCRNCNEEYSNELARCPFCGTLAPLSFLKNCVIIVVIAILIIAIAWIVLGFTKKDHTDEEAKHSLSDVSQDVTSTEPETESEVESETESQTESTDNKPSSNPSTTTSEVATTSKPQEQKPTNQIPQNEINGVKTADITLPTIYDATEGLKHCRDWYRPLSFIHLTYGMDEIVNDYNKQFNGDYILEVGGDAIDKVMTYTYRIRYEFADVSGAKAKFEKHLDDNTEFFKSQLALYKEYSSDVTGIKVVFEHDESNQTLISRTFK